MIRQSSVNFQWDESLWGESSRLLIRQASTSISLNNWRSTTQNWTAMELVLSSPSHASY